MRQVDIWIENETPGVYEKIELFQDEEIIINSSIQNVQDISKVFTDFSQTFTIPASAENNRIFKHYYENAIDTSINPNYRRNAYIEIDLSPFKSGKIAIEKANIVNDKVESYTITFYGLVISLKDKFEKFKLVDLDFTDLNFENTLNNIKSRIYTDADLDICFPLISTQQGRVWNYGLADSNDITTTTGAINYIELNPAIRSKTILNKIATKCGLTFTGAFLNDRRFTQAYLWFQNDKEKLPRTGMQYNVFNDIRLYYNAYNQLGQQFLLSKYYTTASPLEPPFYEQDLFDLQNATIGIQNVIGLESTINNITFNFTIPSGVTKIYIKIFINNKLYYEVEGDSGTDIVAVSGQLQSLVKGNYSFYIQTEDPTTLTGTMTANIARKGFSYVDGGNVYTSNAQVFKYVSDLQAKTFTAQQYNVNDYIPDLTFEDFITSILKTFNLTIIPRSESEFELIPLNDFYSKGQIYDITPYVDIDDITISRIPLSKKNEFKHEKTNNFLNEQYSKASIQSREYGDYIYYDENLEDGEFKIETKFGDISTVKLATNMYVGYALDKAYNPQIQAPLLLYKGSKRVKTFKITDGVNYDNISGYIEFVQETTIDGIRYSIHFSNELSVKDGTTLYNNLFSQYYASYFFGLTNPKNRLTNVTTTFPLSLLTKIKLYDRLIIRDKRYIINDIKQNLTTSEVELNLLHDFRQLINATLPNALQSGGQMSFIMPAPDGGSAQMNFEISLDTEDGIGYETENDLLLLTEYSQTVSGGSQLVTITYPPIQETTYLIDSSGNELITDNGLNIISNEVTGNYFTIDFTLFYEDGSEYTQPYNVFYE
jgi:hypothetical protein